METSKKTTDEPKPNPIGSLGGIDLNGLLNNAPLLELLKHLLSGGAAMAGNYFMWIKPMQDKIEAMSKQIAELEDRIDELEHGKEKTEAGSQQADQGKASLTGSHVDPGEYFTVRKSRPAAITGKRPYTRM